MVSRDRGGLYLGTWHGLFLYDPYENRATELTPSAPMDWPEVKCLTKGSSGTLWIGLVSGVGVKHPDENESFQLLEFTKHLGRVSALTEIDNGVLVIGTESQGLWLAKDQRVSKLELNPHATQNPHIWDLIQYSENSLLIATEKGLFFVQIDPIQKIVKRADLVLNIPTSALMLDRHGVIWAGTEVGLFRTTEAGPMVTVSLDRINGNLRYASVRSFCWLSPSELMVGTDAGQPLFYDFNDHSLGFLSDRYPQLAPLNSQKYIRAIVLDRKSDLWIGSRAGLTYVENPFEGQTRLTRLLPDSVIRVLTELPDSRLLVGTEGQGLFVIDPREVQKRPILMKRSPDSNPFINNAIIDESGALILGTSSGIDFLNLNREVAPTTMLFQDPGNSGSNFVLSTWLSPKGNFMGRHGQRAAQN